MKLLKYCINSALFSEKIRCQEFLRPPIPTNINSEQRHFSFLFLLVSKSQFKCNSTSSNRLCHNLPFLSKVNKARRQYQVGIHLQSPQYFPSPSLRWHWYVQYFQYLPSPSSSGSKCKEATNNRPQAKANYLCQSICFSKVLGYFQQSISTIK